MKWHHIFRVLGVVAFVIGLALVTIYNAGYEVFLLFVVGVGTLVMPEFVDKSGLPWNK